MNPSSRKSELPPSPGLAAQEGTLILSPTAGPPHAEVTIPVPPDGRELVLGRGSEADVKIIDPYRSISRIHARLRFIARRWQICDLSAAGTVLGRQRLTRGLWTELTTGDELSAGAFTFVVRQLTEQPTTIMTSADSPLSHTLTLVPPPKPYAIARGQLEVLLEASRAMHEASGPEQIATLMLRACLSATGYARASLLAAVGDAVELLATESRSASPVGVQFSSAPASAPAATSAAQPPTAQSPAQPLFSRTLVAQAGRGQTVQYTAGDSGLLTQTGSAPAVHSAVCIPVKIGRKVERLLYLDSTQPVSAPAAAAAFAQCIADIAGSVLSGIAASEMRQDQQRHRGQMEAAHDIQVAALPTEVGQFDQIGYNYRIIPARDVAGDLFGVQVLCPTTTAVWFGDVSGKGVPAALLGVMAHAFLSAALRPGEPAAVLADAITRLDGFLRLRCADDRFISLFCGIIDQQHNRLWYIDAGHGLWLTKTASGCQRGRATETVLRVAEPPFTPMHLPFAPGDALILFSDGVLEQSADVKGQFGFDRLIDIASQVASPTEIPKAVVAAVRAFVSASSPEKSFTPLPGNTAAAAPSRPLTSAAGFDDDLSVACIWRENNPAAASIS